jgi:hypothetical protein
MLVRFAAAEITFFFGNMSKTNPSMKVQYEYVLCTVLDVER